MRAEDKAAARPYPELSGAHQSLVEEAFRRGQASRQELTYETGATTEDVTTARELDLLADADARLRPTALALLYLDDPIVDQMLVSLQQLLDVGRNEYRPNNARIGEEVLELDRSTLERIEPYANDLGLDLGIRGEGYALQRSEQHLAWSSLLDAFTTRYRSRNAQAPHETDEGPSPLDFRLVGLRVARFRALRELELELPSSLTVLVGRNGVGKSTVLDAVAFIGRAMHSGLESALRQEGGFERALTRGTSGPLELSFDFTLDPGLGNERGSYSIGVASRGGGPIAEHESLTIRTADKERVLLEGKRAVVELSRADGSNERKYRGVGELTLPTIRDETAFPLCVHIRRDLASISLLDRDPVVATREQQEVYFGQRTGRTRHTANLPRLIAAVAKSPEKTADLTHVLRELVPGVEKVERRVTTGDLPQLEVREEGVQGSSRLDELSAGMRQMLLLACLYVSDTPPRMILLEEPDAGMHVGALHALRDLLRSLARTSVVIATTHSPAFVGLLSPTDEVVALEREETRIRATALDRALQSRKWLRGFGSTAEAFTRGGLEK